MAGFGNLLREILAHERVSPMEKDAHLYLRVIPADDQGIDSEEGALLLRSCLSALTDDESTTRVVLHPRGGYRVHIHPCAHLTSEDIVRHIVQSGYRPCI
jgi:hypothetical protein